MGYNNALAQIIFYHIVINMRLHFNNFKGVWLYQHARLGIMCV